MHEMRRRAALCALALGVVVVAPAALASGFHVYEQGAKASGQAVAFVARADDASAVFYNPAAIVWLDAPTVQVGFSGVFLGDTTFDSTSPVGSGSQWDMFDHTPTPVHLFYAQRFKDSRFAIGFGVTTPFGLVTDWSDPGFDGRYAAFRTDLRTFVYNLNGAVQLTEGLSAAVGVDYLTADLRDFSRWVFVPAVVPVPLDLNEDGTIDLTPNAFAFSNVLSNLDGTGNEWGWNAALHHRSKNWAFGLTYRSGFDVKLDGTASFDLIDTAVDLSEFPALPPEVLDGIRAQVAAGVAEQIPLFLPTGPGAGTIALPSTMALGVAYTGLEKWQFEFDVHRISWSDFDKIPVDFENNTALLDDVEVPENWDDTTAYRLGAAWDIAPAHQLRAGVYTEDSPIPLATLRPSIPDSDRMGYTIGYGYHKGPFAIDLYYMYITLDDVSVTGNDITVSGDPADLTDDYAEYSRLGSYTSTISLAGLTASWKF